MTWHEVLRVQSRRRMVSIVMGHQPSAIARTRSAHLVSCTRDLEHTVYTVY